MGATSYERLSESRRRGGGGAWAVLRRGLLRLCAARRQGRWAQARRGRCCRRVSAGYGYDAEGYARNFDDGVWKADDEGVPWMRTGVAGRCPAPLL
uniref:Uncharacterized protein n=1 Tax=Avena sativa TaxID=4498 RepID=A0ACD5YDX6_AVESA